MRIYLLRHGEAKSEDQDPERHLTEKGIEEVTKVAEFLRPLSVTLRAIWHSGKARAAQTAEIIAGAVESREGIRERAGLAPNDPVQPIVKAVREVGADLMLVGHLPFLGKFASTLVIGDEANGLLGIPSAGLVCLDLREDVGWRVAWMIVPDLLS
jgi:phosphohistidine phosphatase